MDAVNAFSLCSREDVRERCGAGCTYAERLKRMVNRAGSTMLAAVQRPCSGAKLVVAVSCPQGEAEHAPEGAPLLGLSVF